MNVASVTVPHADSVFVAGEWVLGSGPSREVVSPSTGEVVGEVALPSEADGLAAVEAGRDLGLGSWRLLPVGERVDICARFCADLEARLGEVETVWAVEAGMPVRYSRTLHRFGAVGAWQTALACAEGVLHEDLRQSPLGAVSVRREPAGLVVAIMSYNGPLVTMATKVIPALLAGCPVIVKAALESQLIMRIVAQCASAAGFPPGALSILCGDADLGRLLTASPDVDMVSLTGGRAAAQEIIEATRQRFARTHLELGGKSPALILDDAPTEAVLKSLLPGATSGTGQVCAALSRILVSEQRHDELIEQLGAAWRGLRIGDPLDPQTQIGPLATEAARDRAEGFVRRATAAGARVVAGGERPRGCEAGWYFEPTLVTDVAESSDLAQNEVFGPATAVQIYRDLDHAIELANDTSYGLAASVYTANSERGLECASRIRAGSVAINTFGPTVTAPFGGMKGSGWGRESGPEGILEFTELKQVLIGRV